MPVVVIRDLKHYEFARPERVHNRQRYSRHERTEEAPPHRFDAKSVAHFLWRHQVQLSTRQSRKKWQDAPRWRRAHHLWENQMRLLHRLRWLQ